MRASRFASSRGSLWRVANVWMISPIDWKKEHRIGVLITASFSSRDRGPWEVHVEPSSEPTIIVRSECQRALLDRLARVAQTNAEILITGPTGVGKELYAAFAHRRSRRREGPFVAANCSNLSADLLENEIFGHARGAYTGAHVAGDGLAASAEGGTLFLDEIDSLPKTSQAKLLRFIQQREYRRLGETRVRRADIRFVAACNADLPGLVENGHFREDLYFRLRVAPINIPPLVERPDDIPALLEHFSASVAAEYDVEPVTFSPSAMERLLEHDWPGNVRELENMVRYLTCLQSDAPFEVSDIAASGVLKEESKPRRNALVSTLGKQPMKKAKEAMVTEFERLYLEQALRQAGGNVSAAARSSGKDRRAFFELMRKHGIEGRNPEKRGDA
jgi:two-component system, NtrC family, response regulator GlrR